MTEIDIVEAFELCTIPSGKSCAKCPYHIYYAECRTKRNKDVIDLINRQKAEIERLNVELVGMRGACESYKIHYDNAQAKINRLQEMLDSAISSERNAAESMEGETK